MGWKKNQRSGLNLANKTPLSAEGCRRRAPGLAQGAPALPGPSPFPFCLHASLGVEARGRQAELVQRPRLQSSEGWGKRPLHTELD